MARILVADDHPELVELLQAVLAGEGHTVDAVLGGQAALERLEQTVYDLVLCDLAMPEVDGVAVCRAVAQLASPRPAVLLMTGYAGTPTHGDFLQTTHAMVLTKPVRLDRLREHRRCRRAGRSQPSGRRPR